MCTYCACTDGLGRQQTLGYRSLRNRGPRQTLQDLDLDFRTKFQKPNNPRANSLFRFHYEVHVHIHNFPPTYASREEGRGRAVGKPEHPITSGINKNIPTNTVNVITITQTTCTRPNNSRINPCISISPLPLPPSPIPCHLGEKQSAPRTASFRTQQASKESWTI